MEKYLTKQISERSKYKETRILETNLIEKNP